MWKPADAGLWKYQSVKDVAEVARALGYMDQFTRVIEKLPETLRKLSYNAIYVDKGQDFLEQESSLLK
ncbi:MAG TPA: hypothetical protein VGB55_04380 [Tepidisphaeraceae bacterium]|jgi:hypothetical protein